MGAKSFAALCDLLLKYCTFWGFHILTTLFPYVLGTSTPHVQAVVQKSPVLCESRVVDAATAQLKVESMPCPEWDPLERLPAFCCGTDTGEKSCCEWSTYVVNRMGFGRTSVGLVVFVGLFFVAAVIVFWLMCGLFKLFCVARWERSDALDHHRRTASRRRNSNYGAVPSPCPL